MDYTKAQRSAIETIDDPLLIVACAGSGKTQVISQRIVEILRSGAEPRNIVAFTFTDRAAAELKERVTSLVEQEFGNVHGLAEMYIGTMHGFALDVLHGFVPQTFKYGVLNEIQTRLFIDRRSNAVSRRLTLWSTGRVGRCAGGSTATSICRSWRYYARSRSTSRQCHVISSPRRRYTATSCTAKLLRLHGGPSHRG